ncbi:MAG: lipopolysaccharide biosynthesis protein, partial [Legionellales bacterium]
MGLSVRDSSYQPTTLGAALTQFVFDARKEWLISVLNSSDLGRLLLKGIIYRLIYYVSVFTLTVLMSRHYQAASSGSIYYSITILSWIILCLSFCIETAMNYYLASGLISPGKLTSVALVWTAGATVLSYCIFHWILPKSLISLPLSFLYLFIMFIAGNLLISFFSALFYALKDFVSPNLLSFCFACTLILIIPQKPPGPLAQDQFIRMYFISFLIQGILFILLFVLRYVPRMRIEFPSLGSLEMLLSFSTWAFVTNGLTMVLCRIDYWFVNQYCNASDLGNYIQASKVGQLLLVLPAVVSAAIFPMTASGMLPYPAKNIGSLARSLLLVSVILACSLVVAGNWIFPIVFGPSFSAMSLPFALMTPGLLAFCVISPVTSYYGGRKILHVNLISLVAAVTCMVALDALLVPGYG